MEDISDMMANTFNLTSKEDHEVDLGGGYSNEEGAERITFDLVGRVVSERNFSSHSLQSNIERLLRSVKGFQFRLLGDNRFLLHFSHQLDRTHVMEGSPWLLDNSALLFSLIPQEEDPETMEKNLMTIGVKLNNIPLGYHNPSAARRLCTNLGEVLEVIPPKCETPQVYIRVRVRIDIQESLLRGVPLRVRNGTRQWISFSYERLPVYCYLCGLVGHMEKKCSGMDLLIPVNHSHMGSG